MKMRKVKKGFSDKFRLLNSQDNAEINWSCSDSSDYENVPNNDKILSCTHTNLRKRKRKIKLYKNITNLDVTIVDISKDKKDDYCSEHLTNTKGELKTNTSPVFVPRYSFPRNEPIKEEITSPILTTKVDESRSRSITTTKSPILALNHMSPKSSQNVRKKLFDTVAVHCGNNLLYEEIDFEVLKGNNYFDARKSNLDESNIKKTLNDPDLYSKHSNKIFIDDFRTKNSDESNPKEAKVEPGTLTSQISTQSTIESLEKLKKPKSDLAQRIRIYFDSHFSSDSNTQHSISESLTPILSSKTSEEIDIITSITQVKTCKVENQTQLDRTSRNISPVSSESAETNLEKAKKCRYKKNGLAYRLNALLKKQNANISLWQHERFLAENSNFKFPKGENIVFRIQSVNFQYGCYLLRAVDLNDDVYLILINSSYASEVISCETVIKLYQPYKVLDFNKDYKIISNVSKYECVPLKI